LEYLGVDITTLAGSSVGSIVAGLYAVGYTPDELAEIFLSVNFELFRDISFGFNQKFALSKGEVFLDWFRELVEKKFYGETYKKDEVERVCFKDLKRNLVIITTDMKTFSCKEFSTFETPDFEVAMAVRISCCMPGLMRPITLGEELLVDGDLMKGKPMWSLSKTLKNVNDRILEIRLEGTYSGSATNPIEYVNGMYSCMTASETSFIKNVYGKKDKYDYLTINTGNVVVVDFNYPTDKRQAIIDDGYRQTIEYFKNYLVLKKQKIAEAYDEILDRLRNIQGFLLLKKYVAVRNSISEMFIYLVKANEIIDSELFDAISAFQKLTFANIKTGLLGRSICTNRDTISTSLKALIDDTTVRLNEMDKYLKKFSD
jgi:NTE family protein